jgi:hypothetical protein
MNVDKDDESNLWKHDVTAAFVDTNQTVGLWNTTLGMLSVLTL